ncbi:orotate phosphoribosyltransferase [Candidatus Magnetoovum chiemensis]|nr:orotate phosphoribosyltransferase [Candidatus Magnetoovum chiemensis]
MEIDREITAQALLEIKAVRFYENNEPFRLTSGVLSPVYIDCRKLISYPKQRNNVLDEAQKCIKQLNLTIDCIAGGESAGIPYASFLAQRLNLPMVYIRKKPKTFGTGQQIEGFLKENSRVLLVEDLLFDAGSKLSFKTAIEQAGSITAFLICIFCYGSSLADERLNNANLNYLCLTNWDVLLKKTAKINYFTNDQIKTIKNFLANPTDWAKNRSIL